MPATPPRPSSSQPASQAPAPAPRSWRARLQAAWSALRKPAPRQHLADPPGPAAPAADKTPGKAGATATATATATAQPGADALRAYRREAAAHLYALNTARIYAGMLPPQLYAIGVLNVTLGAAGQVLQLHWLRAPQHAPEVVAEIERTVHAAAPFPLPAPPLHSVVYTDTWLWDASGRFQLDTLTEGQR